MDARECRGMQDAESDFSGGHPDLSRNRFRFETLPMWKIPMTTILMTTIHMMTMRMMTIKMMTKSDFGSHHPKFKRQ